MLYLLDANTLIDAKRDYYPIDRIPEFWDWLLFQGKEGNIKIPIEIYEEFKDKEDSEGNKDSLALWAEQEEVRKALLLDEDAEQDFVARITYGGYVPNPTDDELVKIGRDPFLISYGLLDTSNRTIVTTEVSRPTKTGANRKIPDVCKGFDIRCINNFQLLRELDFRTNWQGI